MKKLYALSMSLVLTAGIAAAQDATSTTTTSTTTTTATSPTTPATTPTTTPTKRRMGVNARRERQQQRIGEGVENGSLTAGEAASLEKKENKLAKEEARDRKSGGGLSAGEKAKLERQENTLSRDINRDEHNARTQNSAPKSEIGQRNRRQQERIGEGIENGSLTAKEAGKLENKEAKLNRQERRMRADGTMTAQEKAKVNREQNKLSKDIYKQKHDRQRRHD